MIKGESILGLSAALLMSARLGVGQTQPVSTDASGVDPQSPSAVTSSTKPAIAKAPASQSDNVSTFGLSGYVRFTASNREFVARPVDRSWIENAARSTSNEVQGSTQPSDLFARLEERRDLVLAKMLNDLPTLRPSQIDVLIDTELLPTFRKLAGFRSRPIYLVTAGGLLKAELRSGWMHPCVRWNQVADRLEFERDVRLTATDDGTEELVPAIFEEGRSDDERAALLSRFVVASERQMQQALSTRATSAAIVKVADFLAREALATLPRGEEQVWLPVGLSNVLAAKYVSMFHGSPHREFIEALVTGTAGQSINALQVDLLSPLPIDALRAEAVAPYMDARRRKAVAVTYLLIRDSGEKSVMPLINAIERLRPADGLTLVATIKSICGIDLLPQLRAR